jgi:UDP-N-acetyl-D-mannosaminuronic acid dehydrogenase
LGSICKYGNNVAVVGLGYVGLTLATVMAEVGFRVTGIEVRKDVVDLTNKGLPHFVESGLADALSRVVKAGQFKAELTLDPNRSYDYYIITVGTPLDQSGFMRLDMITAASEQVSSHMRDGALVVLRSTVGIGVSRSVVYPILERSGRKFELAICPERTLEGRAMKELRTLPQVVGADSEQTRTRAAALFSALSPVIVPVSSLETAEVIKLIDNTYRDVQFAFANEVANVCDHVGVRATEVINCGKVGYERTNVAMPGLVGGPCLEKDPHILIQSLRPYGLNLKITAASREINESQPRETVAFVQAEMARRSLKRTAKIVILGLAFKGIPETDDLRGSMSLKVIAELQRFISPRDIVLYDPIITPSDIERLMPGYYSYPSSIQQAVGGSSVVIIANNHPLLGSIKPNHMLETMEENGFIYDYWNHFSNLTSSELLGSYFALGNCRKSLS